MRQKESNVCNDLQNPVSYCTGCIWKIFSLSLLLATWSKFEYVLLSPLRLQLIFSTLIFYSWNLNSHSTIIWDFNHHSRRPSKLHFLNSILSLTRKMGKPRIMFMKFSYFLTFLMIWEILQNTSYSLWKSVRSIFVLFEV